MIEDNHTVARSLALLLNLAGCTVVGPVATIAAGLERVRAGGFDAALLDVDLRGQRAEPVVAVLQERRVPLALVT